MDVKRRSQDIRKGPLGPEPSILKVDVDVNGVLVGQYSLHENTIIGRDDACDIKVDNEYVSRKHIEVCFESGSWWLRDLGSRNGTYVDNKRIERVPITAGTRARLGPPGPTLRFQPAESKPLEKTPAADPDLSEYIDHYFGDGNMPAGERTMFIRRAFETVQTKQRKKYRFIIAAILFVSLLATGYGIYLHLQTRMQTQIAEDIFYQMKSLQVEIARTELAVLKATGGKEIGELVKSRERRRELEQNYDRFLKEIGFYSRNLSEDERLILRMARVFGESELAMPPDFVTEVKSYIRKWQSTDRLKKAVTLASSRNYPRLVANAMLAEDLPPQFFYLALQESNFDLYAVGPQTRMGFAKGPWQFISKTAMEYGLKIGPQFELPRPDPADERHDFQKSTSAAAKYLKFIYSTDAQASGLLVMASYNWGEEKVIPLVQTLPENPRQRNFWQLLTQHRNQIPQETYDYVLSIFSAAVIGENPRMFGFDFDNPLEHLDRKP
jgi:pSer/pThr/pTyr-binding forkhead associated (FHA) protein